MWVPGVLVVLISPSASSASMRFLVESCPARGRVRQRLPDRDGVHARDKSVHRKRHKGSAGHLQLSTVCSPREMHYNARSQWRRA